MPPIPEDHPIPEDNWRRNVYVINAFNFYMASVYSEMGIMVIPAWSLAIPWSEGLVQGRTHLMTTEPEGFIITAPGAESLNLLAYHACIN